MPFLQIVIISGMFTYTKLKYRQNCIKIVSSCLRRYFSDKKKAFIKLTNAFLLFLYESYFFLFSMCFP